MPDNTDCWQGCWAIRNPLSLGCEEEWVLIFRNSEHYPVKWLLTCPRNIYLKTGAHMHQNISITMFIKALIYSRPKLETIQVNTIIRIDFFKWDLDIQWNNTTEPWKWIHSATCHNMSQSYKYNIEQKKQETTEFIKMVPSN